MKICSIDGCNRKHVGKGYCNNHYRLWNRYGRPLDYDGNVREKRIKLEQIFDHHHSNQDIIDECWIWSGCRNDWNYGTATYKGKKSRLVHRVSYEYFRETIPDKMLICHVCDNPPCFNPRHLFVGTASDNVQDCVRKGRYRNWRMIKKEATCQHLNTK